jgi:hydroxyethylthiazole kinase-like uncharacterized protein yjeF
MKILNTKQLKAADRATILNEPIESIDLMERAAIQCVRWFYENDLDDSKKIHIFCGMGNNGGDGLAIARYLYKENSITGTYLVHFSKNMSDDFITNYKRAEEIDLFPVSIHSEDDFPAISKDDIVIDAIFGVGLTRAVTGFTKKLIQYINNSGATIYSIDVPSGLFIDKPVIDKQAVIKSDMTLTFQTPKLAFLLPDSKDFVKDFTILNIGLDKNFIDKIDTNIHFTLAEDLIPLVKSRTKFSHKGSFGHSLLIGGSFGKIGAVVLASKAAVKSGSGLVTAFIPKCGYQIIQTAVPEVMVEVDAENKLEYFNFKVKPSVIGVGIGMGTDDKTAEAFGKFLQSNKLPLVIDADAINIISKNKEFLNYIPENSILTPHPKELERLIGKWESDYDKLNRVALFSTKYKLIVVVKGAHTLVVQNNHLYFNSTGNPALATPGSGDVLTGIITGFLAQGYKPLTAAKIAVFVHGKTADIATLYSGTVLLASEIIQLLPEAFEILIYPEMEQDDEIIDDDYLDDMFFDDKFEAPF